MSALGLPGAGDSPADRKAARVARELNLQVSINLDNFEDSSVQNSKYVLTSPRSLEACARNGIKPVDLLAKPFAYFRDKYSHLGYSDEAIRKLCHDAEHRRLRRLLTAKRDRARMILDETGDGDKLERCEVALAELDAPREEFPLDVSPLPSPPPRPQSAGSVRRTRTLSRESLPRSPSRTSSVDERRYIPRRPASAEPTRPHSARRHLRSASGDSALREAFSSLDVRERALKMAPDLTNEELEQLRALQQHWETELRRQRDEAERAREAEKEVMRQQVLREHRDHVEAERRRDEMQREWERKMALIEELRDAERQKVALNSEYETLKRRAAVERIQRLEDEAEGLRARLAKEIEVGMQRFRIKDERIRNEQLRVAEFNRSERALYEDRRRRLDEEERQARITLDAAIRERDAAIAERAEMHRVERLQTIRLGREREEEKALRQKEAVKRLDVAMREWAQAVQRRRAEADRWAEAVQKALVTQRQAEVREAGILEERRHRERYERVLADEAQQIAEQRHSIAYKEAFKAINASYREQYNQQRRMYALEGQRMRESFRSQRPRVVAEIVGGTGDAIEAATSSRPQLPFVMH